MYVIIIRVFQCLQSWFLQMYCLDNLFIFIKIIFGIMFLIFFIYIPRVSWQTNIIFDYVLSINRAKLAESEATVEQLRRQSLRSPRSPSRMMSSSMSMMSSSMMSSMGGFEAPASPDILGAALIKEAKKELRNMKKQQRKRSAQSLDLTAHGSVLSWFDYF